MGIAQAGQSASGSDVRLHALLTALLCVLAELSGACGANTGVPRLQSNGAQRGQDGGTSMILPPEPDAGPAQGPEHTLRSGQTELCTYGERDQIERAGSDRFSEVSIANDGRGFALVRHNGDGALLIDAFALGQPPQPEVELLAANGAPEATALAATAETFALLYRSGPKLYARVLSPDHDPVALSQALADATDAGGETFALTALADHFVAAWLETREGASALFVQALDLDGAPLASPQRLEALDQRQVLDLQLAPLDRGRSLLAWHERDDSGRGQIMAAPLDTALHAEHDPVVLSKNPVSDARFDLGARLLSAGVVYQSLEGGTRDTVHYRRVNLNGESTEAELNLANAPARARDGSIAAFGQGYAVAYRALPSLGVDEPAIMVAFINQFGRVVYQAALDATSEAGGRTSLSASSDGHVLVGWSTALPSGGATTHAVQLDCPGALVLCGGGNSG